MVRFHRVECGRRVCVDCVDFFCFLNCVSVLALSINNRS